MVLTLILFCKYQCLSVKASVSWFQQLLSRLILTYTISFLTKHLFDHFNFLTHIHHRNKIVASLTDGCDHFLFTQHTITSTLSTFTLIQSGELQGVVQQLSSATCSLDLMPTKLFKNVFSCLIEDVLEIVNASLHSGIFPSCLKHAIVTPLLN